MNLYIEVAKKKYIVKVQLKPLKDSSVKYF